MQIDYGHRNDSAWVKGDLAYELGDTLEIGKVKAAQAGIKPCSNEYAAFMTAFGRRIRAKQVSPHKRPENVVDLVQVAPAVAEDVWRAAS